MSEYWVFSRIWIKTLFLLSVQNSGEVNRKLIGLIVLNLAAAAALGIIAGMYFKYMRNADVSDAVNVSCLQERIALYADTLAADVGVAAIFDNRDTLVYCNSVHDSFPMMSVMKFHQALAVCAWLRETGRTLDTVMEVKPDDLHENTWSPLRDSYPDGGKFSWRELLEYTLGSSDNNVCDILFKCIGGPDAVDRYVRSLGIDDFAIECTEAMMHEDLSCCDRNWTTPLSAVRLLEEFRRTKDKDEYSEFIWNTMAGCRTGQGRIPGGIPDTGVAGDCDKEEIGRGDGDDGDVIGYREWGVDEGEVGCGECDADDEEETGCGEVDRNRVGDEDGDRNGVTAVVHKTGTGDLGPDGRIIAVNDIGTVVLPDGGYFSIAVFVSDASCSIQECEAVIAHITRMVYDHALSVR